MGAGSKLDSNFDFSLSGHGGACEWSAIPSVQGMLLLYYLPEHVLSTYIVEET